MMHMTVTAVGNNNNCFMMIKNEHPTFKTTPLTPEESTLLINNIKEILDKADTDLQIFESKDTDNSRKKELMLPYARAYLLNGNIYTAQLETETKELVSYASCEFSLRQRPQGVYL